MEKSNPKSCTKSSLKDKAETWQAKVQNLLVKLSIFSHHFIKNQSQRKNALTSTLDKDGNIQYQYTGRGREHWAVYYTRIIIFSYSLD